MRNIIDIEKRLQELCRRNINIENKSSLDKNILVEKFTVH